MTTDSTPAQKKRLSGRIARGVMSIILPVQETTWFLRSARHMTARNLARMRHAFPEPADSGAAPPASPDWEKAVADSGCTPAQLEKNYLSLRRRWRVLFWLMAVPVPLMLLLPVFSAAGITAHQVSTCLVLFAGAGVAWSRALIITYRLWQLRSRRVSLAEGGTFRHFLTETRAVRNAIRGR